MTLKMFGDELGHCWERGDKQMKEPYTFLENLNCSILVWHETLQPSAHMGSSPALLVQTCEPQCICIYFTFSQAEVFILTEISIILGLTGNFLCSYLGKRGRFLHTWKC